MSACSSSGASGTWCRCSRTWSVRVCVYMYICMYMQAVMMAVCFVFFGMSSPKIKAPGIPSNPHPIPPTNTNTNNKPKAREPRPAVQSAILASLTLLLYNAKRDEALHYLLSQNWLNDLLAAFFDPGGAGGRGSGGGGEEVRVYGVGVCDEIMGWGVWTQCTAPIPIQTPHPPDPLPNAPHPHSKQPNLTQVRAQYVSLLRTIAQRITAGTAPLFLDHRKAGRFCRHSDRSIYLLFGDCVYMDVYIYTHVRDI